MTDPAPTDLDEDFVRAVRLVTEHQFGAPSFVARKLGLPFATVRDLMARMETLGIIAPTVGTKAHEVLLTVDEAEDLLRYGVPEALRIEPQTGRGATNPTPPDGGQGDTAENPPTSLTARILVKACAEAAWENGLMHLDGPAAITRRVLARAFRELAADAAGYPELVTTDQLLALADEIDANTTHQENP